MFHIDQSLLLVIDVQEKLASIIHDRDETLRHIAALIKAAGFLKIPVLFTEQAPDKIGPTVELLTGLAGDAPVISKTAFSCYGSSEFNDVLKRFGRSQIIVCGIEAHVCVYQTVAGLLERGLAVEVVGDAISSRRKEHKEIALERMKQLGAGVTCAEMIVTELVGGADHPQFKNILSLIK